MRVQVRLTLITSLSLALWLIVDGAKCLITGTYFGQRLTASMVKGHPTALRLPEGGGFIDYGRWAALLVDVGFDPHALAPFFIALGVLGALGLFFFLQARPLGWAMLCAFAVAVTLRMDAMAVLAAALLVVLMLPATRKLVFTRTVRVQARPVDGAAS